MSIWRLDELIQVLEIDKSQVNSDLSLTSQQVQFNSQDVQAGDLFIALRSGARDGHSFVAHALSKGASFAIVEHGQQDLLYNSATAEHAIIVNDRQRLLFVNDTMQALEKLAAYKRKSSKATFIAITGSVGKTTTKEVAKLVFSEYGKVFAGRGNFNNKLGLLVNLASMPRSVDYAIFELGMSAVGEIAELSDILRPNLGIITAIAPAHLEFFTSIEGIAAAKCEIFKSIDPVKGVAILNSDMPLYDYCLELAADIQQVYNFGCNKDSDSCFTEYKILNNGHQVALSYVVTNNTNVSTLDNNELVPSDHGLSHSHDNPLNPRLSSSVAAGGKQEQKLKFSFIRPLIPKHVAANFAAIFAALSALRLDYAKTISAFQNFQVEAGRGQIANFRQGNKQYKIICDYYNSNPVSLKAALEYMGQINAPTKAAVIGDMLELGTNNEAELHREMVPAIRGAGINRLFLVGKAVKNIYNALSDRTDLQIRLFATVEECAMQIDNMFNDGDLILLKGSRGIRLNLILESLEKGQDVL